MPSKHIEQLHALARRLEGLAAGLGPEAEFVLDSLETAAADAAAAWSGSNIGYHACVYYADLQAPPPGMHFSSEWGLRGTFAPGTYGDWREYNFDAVLNALRAHTGEERLDELKGPSETVAAAFADEQSRFESLTSSASAGTSDPYLDDLRRQAAELQVISYSDGLRAQLPHGSFGSRDALAMSAGLKPAPHQAGAGGGCGSPDAVQAVSSPGSARHTRR